MIVTTTFHRKGFTLAEIVVSMGLFSLMLFGLFRLESKQVSIDSVPVPRDRISFATVSDWNDVANFRPNSGLPVWDQQLLFASDLETPIGQFGFARVNPTSSKQSGENLQLKFSVVPINGL